MKNNPTQCKMICCPWVTLCDKASPPVNEAIFFLYIGVLAWGWYMVGHYGNRIVGTAVYQHCGF